MTPTPVTLERIADALDDLGYTWYDTPGDALWLGFRELAFLIVTEGPHTYAVGELHGTALADDHAALARFAEEVHTTNDWAKLAVHEDGRCHLTMALPTQAGATDAQLLQFFGVGLPELHDIALDIIDQFPAFTPRADGGITRQHLPTKLNKPIEASEDIALPTPELDAHTDRVHDAIIAADLGKPERVREDSWTVYVDNIDVDISDGDPDFFEASVLPLANCLPAERYDDLLEWANEYNRDVVLGVAHPDRVDDGDVFMAFDLSVPTGAGITDEQLADYIDAAVTVLVDAAQQYCADFGLA
ncbi:YbjN domain-containing protein [Corynebacterium sp. TAE3-ERU12]|uniref:YbjN domain-containing protein n=1 Tax=Corynebacterium sp. TAE3-ERU12 TaxID=2849491 RepID=UPI001C47219E|nr:YbjN domain-containing protein [Corynebacterium sp. TAE3-ERU12]MBV7295662.1 YbjN domain-containing protein [Corynebacterium sp. TAE3-ERU12]